MLLLKYAADTRDEPVQVHLFLPPYAMKVGENVLTTADFGDFTQLKGQVCGGVGETATPPPLTHCQTTRTLQGSTATRKPVYIKWGLISKKAI